MATVNEHLSLDELQERYVSCGDVTAARHFQAIWLLARGHTVSQVSATTAFGERWIEQLLARYNAEGPDALGDLRRRNGASATILKPELLDKLRQRLGEPPVDGGLWSSRRLWCKFKRSTQRRARNIVRLMLRELRSRFGVRFFHSREACRV